MSFLFLEKNQRNHFGFFKMAFFPPLAPPVTPPKMQNGKTKKNKKNSTLTINPRYVLNRGLAELLHPPKTAYKQQVIKNNVHIICG